jgi:DNA polymerase
LAWLAGQQDALDVFEAGQDIYVETARKVGSSNRNLGKVLVLACGFGMGHVRFRQTALTYGVVLDEDEASDAVRAWREVNHRIVGLWWGGHRALMRVMRAGPGGQERVVLHYYPQTRRLADQAPQPAALGLPPPADRDQRSGL